MAAVVVEFGQSHTEKRSLSLTRADKERILQNFPEKISVSVPGFGAQEFPLRVQVKSVLDQIQPPVAKATFEVRGSADDPDAISINNSRLKVLGVRAGSLEVLNASVAYEFDADIEPEGTTVETCTCDDGREGQQVSRTFKLVWTIAIDIEPGIGGEFEIEETDISIMAPCSCPESEAELVEAEAEQEHEAVDEDDEEREDKEDRGGGKKKSGKKKRKGRD
ncbi:MAG: hypothetical protein JOZ94_12945 [Xanthobacteraceae bacterium]|nr:hypothetical protein [Xanthobacteraceae bacterium]MBV9236736.1 hypothetical protein [Xanthobacteraceae bacterium]MBV9629637.1 hypothetical protein [Xanthobacteraceae bacterium]